MSKMAKLWKIICKFIKRFDLFSQKIMLTYKGESSFSTFLGGFTSLIILGIVWIYSIFLLQIMLNRQNSNNSKSTSVVDLVANSQPYYKQRKYSFSNKTNNTSSLSILLKLIY